jgi:hypothetical protein
MRICVASLRRTPSPASVKRRTRSNRSIRRLAVSTASPDVFGETRLGAAKPGCDRRLSPPSECGSVGTAACRLEPVVALRTARANPPVEADANRVAAVAALENGPIESHAHRALGFIRATAPCR